MSNFMSYENAQSVLGEFAEAIKSGGGGSSESSSLLIVTFDSDFVGESYTIKQGNTTIKTGTVPQSCEVRFTVQGANETYYVYSSIDSKEYSNSVSTVEYYGEYKVHLYKYHIYGARWTSDPSTVWERTDDAAEFTDPVPYVAGAENYGSPFDNIYPWSGMTRVQYNNDADLEMVKIPRFWYKLEEYGDGGLSIKIADAPVEGFSVCPACRKHWTVDDSDFERSYVLVGRYQSSYIVYSGNGKYASKSPVAYGSLKFVNNFATGDTTLGYYDETHRYGDENTWSMDFGTWFSIHLLYLVEFANWNVNTSIGTPPATGSRGNGETDNMPYHTGTVSSDRTTAGAWQYRYIENLRNGYMATWLPGISYRYVNGVSSIIFYDRLDTIHNDMVKNIVDSPWIRIIPTKSVIRSSAGCAKKVNIYENSPFAFMAGDTPTFTNWQTTYSFEFPQNSKYYCQTLNTS